MCEDNAAVAVYRCSGQNDGWGKFERSYVYIHISRYNIFSICIVEMQDCFSLKVVALMYTQ